MIDMPYLSILIWLPICGGLAILALSNDKTPNVARVLALLIALLSFSIAVYMRTIFDVSSYAMQFVERKTWIEAIGVQYYLGIDGISFALILLTTLTTPLIIIASWQIITRHVAQYLAAFLVLQGFIIGVFTALDAVLFYVFWEAVLIPMFIIIGIWGGPRRVYATIKFFLYTFLGSLFMLVSLIYLYAQSGSFSILDFYALSIPLSTQTFLFFALLFAFAVKVPMWPVHTWLPDAHVEAPTGGSAILAAVLLKLGGYGMLRLSLPILPDACRQYAWLIIALSLVAVVYIGLVAIVQTDMKKLIAYSSVAHMGFVTLGFFLCFALVDAGYSGAALMGLEGGVIQMLSHGFISAALFMCIGVLYDRMHSREISSYGGVANTMPIFAALMMVFAMANVGLPGTSGFVGEFLVILSAFQANFWFAFLAAMTLLLGPAYTLWMYKRVIFGDVANEQVAALRDINMREAIVLLSLLLFVLGFGLWPKPMVDLVSPSLEHLLRVSVLR